MGFSIREAGQAGGSDVLSVVGPSVGLKMWHTAAGILISELGKFLAVPPGGTQTEMVKQLSEENAEQIRAATEGLREEIRKTQDSVQRVVDSAHKMTMASVSETGGRVRAETEQIAEGALRQIKAETLTTVNAVESSLATFAANMKSESSTAANRLIQAQRDSSHGFEQTISIVREQTERSLTDSTKASVVAIGLSQEAATANIKKSTAELVQSFATETQRVSSNLQMSAHRAVQSIEDETRKTVTALHDTGSEVSKQMRDAANDAMFKAVETVNTAADATATAVAKVGQTVYAHMSQVNGQFDQQLQRLEAVAQRGKP
jgi:hypothetical protein